MTNALLNGLSALPGWNVSLLMLLAKATIILITAIGVTMAMQRASAGARHLVWLVTLGTLLLVPALTAWAPLRLKVLPAESATTTALGVPNPVPVPTPVPSLEQSGVAADRSASAIVPPTRDPAPVGSVTRLLAPLANMSGVSMVVSVWLLVVAAIGVSLLWASFAVRRIVKQARPLDTEDWRTPLWEVADRMGLDDVPRLLRSEEAKMPFACGLTTPTIVLPAESDSWSLDRRRAVLLHELAHVRRHDLLGHTLGRLVCAVYWFHPLVWTAAKQLRNESERACDDLALSCGTRATDYAEHLLDIVTSVRRDATPSVALAMARRKEFEGRMLAILDPELRRLGPSRRQSAVLISTLALVALTVGASAPVPRDAVVNAAQQSGDTEVNVARDAIGDHEVGIPTDAREHTPVVVRSAQDTGAPRVAANSNSNSNRKELWLRTDTNTSAIVSAATSTSTSAAMSVSTSSGKRRVGDSFVNSMVRIGINAGVNAAAEALSSEEVKNAMGETASAASVTALRAIIQDKTQGKSDERPTLLAKVLRTDSSASLRRIAAWGLQEHTETSVGAAALANAVRRDASESVREMAAWALGSSSQGSSAASEALIAALKSDASDKVRATAAWSLGNMGDRASMDGLIAALSDKSSSVRSRAIWAIGNVEPQKAPAELVAKLKDEDTRVRRVAAWALFTIEDPSTAPALEAALKAEKDTDVQVDYIRALAAMGDKSVDAIKGLLESPDPRIRTMAVRALAGGRASGPWPWPWPEPRPFP